MYLRFLFIGILFLFSTLLAAQNPTALVEYEIHLQQAHEFDNVSLYADCINEINAAIQIAKDQQWLEKEIAASLFLAEIKRKTADFKEGLSLLRTLKSSVNYPKLHVRKLGRMAAMLNGLSAELTNEYEFRDSVLFYLDSALKVSSNLNLRLEQAGLYNELGYTLGATNVDSSLFYLNKAAELFMELNDTPNYVVVKTNLMRTYVLQNDYKKGNPIIEELIQITQNENFNVRAVQLEFYRTLTFYYQRINDSLKFNYWNVKKYKTKFDVLKTSNSDKLNSFRVLFETKKYQEEVLQKEMLLEKESERRKEYIQYFIGLVILIVGVGLLLYRERKLKRVVNKANENYHMLLVESNHRIKNNLQMIISMLEFSSKDLVEKDSIAFKRMSGKIQTISALHKHLYLDVHNEKVELNTYFADIIDLYQEITNSPLKIEKKVDQVAIPSERIVYFGLIFNEMLSNTLEHSTSLDKTVYITIDKVEDRFRLTYQDHSSFNLNATGGTGTNLIEQLVKRIEGKSYTIEKETGKYQFEFYV